METALDTKILSDFIFELNISRRCVTSYPKGHPVISASMKKVLSLLSTLLEFREEITLGVARDTLIFSKEFLDRKNPVYQDYAKILFHHGIAAFTVVRGLEAEELLRFNEILGRNRDEIREEGGIERAVETAEIRHLRVKIIEYGLFRATEDDRIEVPANGGEGKKDSAIWGDFVRSFIDGTIDPSGERPPAMAEITPALLAQIINEKGGNDLASGELSYEREIASYIRRVLGTERDSLKRKAYLDKLAQFVDNLNPQLRRQFLSQTLNTDELPKEFAEEVLPQIPKEVVLETLENINVQGASPSPLILRLFQKLSKGSRPGDGSMTASAEWKETNLELSKKLGEILREDDIEFLMPQSYRKTLEDIVASGNISGLESDEAEILKKNLASNPVDVQMATIIVEILKSGQAEENQEGLERNLADLSTYFLEVGDFQALSHLHGQLMDATASVPLTANGPIRKILGEFEKREFVEAVLQGIHTWGKEEYPHIEKLVQKIGRPFAEPVLERLGEETSLSIRRFYTDLLLKLGDGVKNGALSRLRDRRWYFVRNLVLVLRNLGDPSVLPAIKKLRGHPHPRVREEVFRTLSSFQDPEAEQMLLEDLASPEREIQRGAVQLAEDSRHPAVLNKLLELLNRGGIFGIESNFKIEVIWALARIGNPQTFPHLERLLRSRTFLHRQSMNRLKMEAVGSLEFYPAQEATIFLQKFSKDRELGEAVSQTLKKIQARTNP